MIITSLFIIIFGIFLLLAIRSMLRSYKRTMSTPQPKMPVLSLSLLATTFILLLASIYATLSIDDALGNLLAMVATFLCMLEIFIRRRREMIAKKAEAEKSAVETNA